MTIGFKEWALVCDALGSGAQSLLLRKGGIAEGRAGFRFQHDDFLLLPTLFHEQAAQLKVPGNTPLPQAAADGQHEITLRVRVEWAEDVTDLEAAHRLAPYHLWRPELVEERFRYKDDPRLSVAFVRVERLAEPFRFPDSPRYGGCRSWVNLPDLPAGTQFIPVLNEQTHRIREEAIREALRGRAVEVAAPAT
jgi:hypothetical protein